jgi:hypothetical protein
MLAATDPVVSSGERSGEHERALGDSKKLTRSQTWLAHFNAKQQKLQKRCCTAAPRIHYGQNYIGHHEKRPEKNIPNNYRRSEQRKSHLSSDLHSPQILSPVLYHCSNMES